MKKNKVSYMNNSLSLVVFPHRESLFFLTRQSCYGQLPKYWLQKILLRILFSACEKVISMTEIFISISMGTTKQWK